MDQKTFLQELSGLGVDVVGSVERCAESEELYVTFLLQFPEDENYSELKAAFVRSDYEAMLKYSHAMKGLTGNLGLNKIYDELFQMVSDLRACDYSRLEEQMRVINEQYELLCSLIGKVK